MIPQSLKQFLKRFTWLEHGLRRVRSRFYTDIAYRFGYVGKNVICNGGLKLAFRDTRLGDNVFVGYGCYFGVRNIRVHDHVLLAPQVAMTGGDHRFDLVGTPINQTGLESWRHVQNDQQGIEIQADAWIGLRAIILDGVTIGEGAIIGAGSVVTSSVEPYTIYAGVPAKKIRDRFESQSQAIEHSKAIGGSYHETVS